MFNQLQIIAAYYSRQTPGGKILHLNGFSFSPKDGIGYNGGREGYSDYGLNYVLVKIGMLENNKINKMNIHPRLKEILRALKVLSYYHSFFVKNRYREKREVIDVDDIVQTIQDIDNGIINFSAEEMWHEDMDKEKIYGIDIIHKMTLNDRLKLSYAYADHHNRVRLAFDQLIKVMELHFANEIFILLRLKHDKKQYQNSRR